MCAKEEPGRTQSWPLRRPHDSLEPKGSDEFEFDVTVWLMFASLTQVTESPTWMNALAGEK